MDVFQAIVSMLRRVTGRVAGLMPEPPSGEPEPPDIDGRRRSSADPEALRRVKRAEKDGKGGYR